MSRVEIHCTVRFKPFLDGDGGRQPSSRGCGWGQWHSGDHGGASVTYVMLIGVGRIHWAQIIGDAPRVWTSFQVRALFSPQCCRCSLFGACQNGHKSVRVIL